MKMNGATKFTLPMVEHLLSISKTNTYLASVLQGIGPIR